MTARTAAAMSVADAVMASRTRPTPRSAQRSALSGWSAPIGSTTTGMPSDRAAISVPVPPWQTTAARVGQQLVLRHEGRDAHVRRRCRELGGRDLRPDREHRPPFQPGQGAGEAGIQVARLDVEDRPQRGVDETVAVVSVGRLDRIEDRRSDVVQREHDGHRRVAERRRRGHEPQVPAEPRRVRVGREAAVAAQTGPRRPDHVDGAEAPGGQHADGDARDAGELGGDDGAGVDLVAHHEIGSVGGDQLGQPVGPLGAEVGHEVVAHDRPLHRPVYGHEWPAGARQRVRPDDGGREAERGQPGHDALLAGERDPVADRFGEARDGEQRLGVAPPADEGHQDRHPRDARSLAFATVTFEWADIVEREGIALGRRQATSRARRFPPRRDGTRRSCSATSG